MVKLSTVIVDDDPLNNVDLKAYLKPYRDDLEIAAEFRDGKKACQFMNSTKPDLAFLDIEMPGLSGFQMLSKLSYSPVIVFVTAFEKYALESYDYSPVDFLLKPVDPAKLDRAIVRAFDDFHASQHEKRISDQQAISGHLSIKYRDIYGISRQPFILPDDIVYIKTCSHDPHFIEILTIDGDLHGPVRQSLSQIKRQLDNRRFLQVYKNIVANRSQFIELVDNHTLILKAKELVRVEVSRRYKKSIKESLKSND